MAAMRDEIDKLVEALKRERDELEVQLHLAKLDAKAEWEATEKKRAQLLARVDELGDAAGDSAEKVAASTRKLAQELREDYQRLWARAMPQVEAETKNLLTTVKRERDELRVRVRLAQMETRDEWQAVEKKWNQLMAHNKRLLEAAGEAGDDVREATKSLAEEIREGYKRIRRAL